MKKTGFTLAEVLITLGIIGVVAAMVLPTLQADTVAAQIGPKLSKAASSFEQANIALLENQGVDALTDSDVFGSASNYITALGDHMKGTVNGATITTKDGISYTVSGLNANASTVNPHRVTCANLRIDINGSNRPNSDAEDRFYFDVRNDGSLRPKGSNDGPDDNWTNKCAADATPTDATYCAGHIFENNLKVLYR